MRRGNAAGSAGEADDLTIPDDLATLHIDSREMRVQRVDAESVVEDDGVAREVEVFRQYDARAVRCVHGRSLRRPQIRAGVRRPRLPVENAAFSEIAAALSGNGNSKRLVGDDVGC